MIEWSHDWFIVTRLGPRGLARKGNLPLHVGVKKTYVSVYFYIRSFPSVRLLSPAFSVSPSRQCLRLPPLPLLRPLFACPLSLARAGKRNSSLTSTTSMRNRRPSIPPDRTLAAQGAPADPEPPFLHPNVHLKSDRLSPALHRTPPPQRSPMPNRKRTSPPEPKSLPLRKTRNHTTIFPEWRQSLIVPAQSSLVEAPSEASLATDGGWVWDAKTKTRRTSSQK